MANDATDRAERSQANLRQLREYLQEVEEETMADSAVDKLLKKRAIRTIFPTISAAMVAPSMS
jgi:hypothetical protein